jgi:hypothetical protein
MREPANNAPTTSSGAPRAWSGEQLPWLAFAALWQGPLRLAWQWNSELLRFSTERWHKDRDTLIQLASCRSPAEVLCVQFEVVADASSDYLNEARQLLAGISAALQPAANTTQAISSA